ncbi:MAG: TAXI family TRAP transporter solute-binding subunit, partial [Acidobacteriota bacterium]
GSVFLEPLWVFHRRSLEVSLLSDLRGRSLAVGAEGSGTQALVRELLGENGIHGDPGDDAETPADDGGATTPPTLLVPLGSADAIVALRSGEVDAAFFVTSARASYLPDLLDDESFALMPFRRYRAYHVRHPFLTHVVLGEGVLDLRENLPAQDVPLLAAAASLVAHRNLHHALVPLLVAAQEEVHRDGGLFEDAGTFPATRWSDLPLRKEAFHYIENGPSFLYRVLNYRTAAAVDRLKILLLPFIPLLLVVFKAAPPIYRWRIRSKIFRWYDDLRAIDRRVLDGPTPQEAAGDLEEVLQLEKEVTDVTVPLSYMDEFYDLRIHIELIKGKLTDLVGESAPPPR